MNLAALGRQLSGEIKRSPKKAALLGLLLAVAAWFWVPLLWGWLSPASVNQAAQLAAENQPDANTGAQQKTSGDREAKDATNQPRYSWEQLAQWMEQEQQEAVASLPKNLKNPFITAPAQEDEEPADEETSVDRSATEPSAEQHEMPQEREFTPEQLGLRLTATLLGGGSRMAVVSGAVYKQGNVIDVPAGTRPPGPSQDGRGSGGADGGSDSPAEGFTVEEIEADHIVLTRKGKHYVLPLTQSRLKPFERIQLVVGSPADH